MAAKLSGETVDFRVVVGVTLFKEKHQYVHKAVKKVAVEHIARSKGDLTYQTNLTMALMAQVRKEILSDRKFYCSLHPDSKCRRRAIDLVMSDNHSSFSSLLIPVLAPSCGYVDCVHTGRTFARQMAKKIRKDLDFDPSKFTNRQCECCGKTEHISDPEGKLERCSRCRLVSYCSLKCQKADWKLHKPLCGKSVLSTSTTAMSTDWICQEIKDELLVYKKELDKRNEAQEKVKEYTEMYGAEFIEALKQQMMLKKT